MRLWPLLQQLAERMQLPQPTRSVSPLLAYGRAFVREAIAKATRAAFGSAYDSTFAAPSLRCLDVSTLCAHRLIDAAAAKRDLGYQPLVSLQETIRRFAADAGTTASTDAAAKSAPAPAASLDPPAGTQPPSAVAALREWAIRTPTRPAMVFTRTAIPSTLRRRLTLLGYVILFTVVLFVEIGLAIAESQATPMRVSHAGYLKRNTATGMKDEVLLLLLVIFVRVAWHPDRVAPHRRLLASAWHSWSYMQLAAMVSTHAATLKRAGLTRGSTVLILWSPPTKAHAIALKLAVQAVGATLLEGEVLTLGVREYCKAIAAAKPDFIIGSFSLRLALAFARPLAACGLVPGGFAVPSGYRWLSSGSLRSTDAAPTVDLKPDELATALPTPPDDAVAMMLIAANDRAVWVSGGASGTASGGAGGVSSIATPLPILHWMLRERARQ